MRWMMMALAALTAIPTAAAAAAEPVFATAPVGDDLLAELRGGQSPFARLTQGAAARMMDDHARADLRLTGGVARVEMDVWWGSTGAELVAASVRAASAP